MLIGTNHGSLSDRIMNRYGDTPLGMVESAMEFTRICIDENYHEIIFSMKASNPQVMIQAYRLLVATMMKKGMHQGIISGSGSGVNDHAGGFIQGYHVLIFVDDV